RFFEDASRAGTSTKIDVAPSGKWIRAGVRMTGGNVAVAGVFLPNSMSRMIDESIIANRNFVALRSQRQTLKASQTSMFLAVTLAILFGTLWTSIYASRRVTIPIKALAEATGRLAAGRSGQLIPVPAAIEVGILIEACTCLFQHFPQQR